MNTELTLRIDDDVAEVLDKIADEVVPREFVAAEILRDWCITAGYLPSDYDIKEDTPT